MDYEILVISLFSLTYLAFGGRFGWASKSENHPLAKRVLLYVKALIILYVIVGAPLAWYFYGQGQKQAVDTIVIQFVWIVAFALPFAYFFEYSARNRRNK